MILPQESKRLLDIIDKKMGLHLIGRLKDYTIKVCQKMTKSFEENGDFLKMGLYNIGNCLK